MRLTKLLASSAAILTLAGPSQAADLAVAEPIDYVKVCDAFGAGFFYSPGTDTCIKIGGYVEFGTTFGHSDFGPFNSTYDNSPWGGLYTETSVQLTASSVTEFGNLTGFIDMRAQTGNTGTFSESLTEIINSASNSAYMDSAFLALGPVKAGYFTSLFDFGRGYTDTGAYGSDSTTDHIEFDYAANGLGFGLSIEDPRDRGATGYDFVRGGQNNIPEIIGAATLASGIVTAKLAAAYTNVAVDRTGNGTTIPFFFSAESGFALGGGLEFALDKLHLGDKLFVSASYGENANAYTGIAGGTSVAGLAGFSDLGSVAAVAPGTSWSALASYQHNWTSNLWTAATAGYAAYNGTGQWYGEDGLSSWRAVASNGWTPVKGLDLLIEALYSEVDGEGSLENGNAWGVNFWMKRSW